MTLDELRQRLNELDRRLIELVAERKRIGREVAEAKRSGGRATRDFAREREVILAARAHAAELGASPDTAEELMRLMIRSSLTIQEQARVAAHGGGAGQRVLVIGGAGKMGGWFVRFLGSQGFDVEVADPAAGAPGLRRVDDWRSSDLQQDYIVVATPLGVTNGILCEIALRRPPGVIFDLGSLKMPLRTGHDALRAAGLHVTSVHPMFGPQTNLLSGRHMIFIDLGNGEALAAARALFRATMAEQVVMGPDEHDRLIAYVLGLSHAVNIAFLTALAGSGEAAPRLVEMSSTTFDAQFDVASAVSEESPELYFEIQQLNAFGIESLDALAAAVEALRSAVSQGDFERFRALMRQGYEYTRGRRLVTERRA